MMKPTALPDLGVVPSFRWPLRAHLGCAALVAVGVFTFLKALSLDPERVWAAFLHQHVYFFSLSLGALFFTALQPLTSAFWSAALRRWSEALVAYLPWALPLFGILWLGGLSVLYPWADPGHVLGDPLLEEKAAYLNPTFFGIRHTLSVLGWILFAILFWVYSIRQDASKNPLWTSRRRFLSPLFCIFFGVTFTFASFDLLMSLDPHWFSTIFGVYCFSGLFYSALAAICLLTLWFRQRGGFQAWIHTSHLHDLGKFLFAFTVFWAYIAFSQFMLIWYANLPEETGYFLKRLAGGWEAVSLFLLVGKFLIPFLCLLPQPAKRSPRVLWGISIWMLGAHWVDLLWLIQPEFFESGPVIGWVEGGLFLGFLGLFLESVGFFLSRVSPVAVGDPQLQESLEPYPT